MSHLVVLPRLGLGLLHYEFHEISKISKIVTSIALFSCKLVSTVTAKPSRCVTLRTIIIVNILPVPSPLVMKSVTKS